MIARSGALTGYTADLIVDDLRRARAGARLDVTVLDAEADLAAIRERLMRAAGRGVVVSVRLARAAVR
jgi:hypothetical protein